MREVFVILRRELKSYFLSPIAYVFGALLLALQLYLATEATFRQDGPVTAQSFFGTLPWLFLIFLPALTMRLWAEERKLGTLELLLTFPVTSAQLILGKFLAALAYLGLILLLSMGFPLTLGMYGELDWGPVVAAYLASMLMAAAYVALGMFFSSLTRDQIVALLASVVALVLLFLLGLPTVTAGLTDALPSWLSWVVPVVGAASPYQYFQSISRGVLDTRDFLYYACFCAFFLQLNGLVLQGRRLKG